MAKHDSQQTANNKALNVPLALTDKGRGSTHYKGMAIEPMEFAIRNQLPWAEGEVIKYISRWRLKGGVEDLKKAQHVLDGLICWAEAQK